MKPLLFILALALCSVIDASAKDTTTTQRDRNREVQTTTSKASTGTRVKRSSPLISEPVNKETIITNRYLSIGLGLNYMSPAFEQTVVGSNDNVIYDAWNELTDPNLNLGLYFKIRLPSEAAFFKNIWFNMGLEFGTNSFTASKNNAFFTLNDEQTIIDHDIEYEYSYINYLLGALYVIELSEHFSINPGVNVMFANADDLTALETDRLETPGVLFSNGQNVQTGTNAEPTLRNVKTLQFAVDGELRLFNDSFSVLLGPRAYLTLDDLVNPIEVVDRTEILTTNVLLSDRSLTSFYLGVSLLLQYNF